ncbi:PcfJ domain-containing protein [Cytobacillus kochii]|uniref:PcfJ domain-containing protein n=1 Tax=Cytobacillus kochii TaxID=859143 RepID=UPI00259FF034|nr:PcfJ domain-containing protein [Cytobacillus kochii]MDM5205346.1 PcfJ domain-containing protein [Cytobacillus kochii]
MNANSDFETHFSSSVSEELKSYIINEALIHSRYFYVKRMTSSLQRGCCTHCKSNHVVSSDKLLKHNEIWKCEKCHSHVLVKSIGRGRGKMIDKVYVIWYEKSLIDSQAITATGYYVSMDYRGDMMGETTIIPASRYLFENGKSTMKHRNYYISETIEDGIVNYENGWVFASKPFSMLGKSSFTVNSEQSVESLKKAIEGTIFSYSQWEYYYQKNIDLVKFFAAFSKYPFVEYLMKMGMTNIVTSMVDNWNLYRCINFRGKTMEKILGLTKKEINDWKASGIIMTPALLSTYKWFKRRDVKVSWQTAESCDSLITGTYYKERFARLQTHLSNERIIRYAENQMKKEPERHRSILNVITSWTDYLNECEELGIDVTQEKALLPNSLYRAHLKTSRSIKLKKDEIVNQKIEKLQQRLKQYHFEGTTLFVRPAVSTEELFEEGEKLVHCVGGYANRYAEGKIAILFIRKKEDPDTPFYTVELDLKANRITQCRGYDNEDATKEVEAFVEAFKLAKFPQNRRERKMAI